MIRHIWLTVHPRITLENLDQTATTIYYQADFELADVPDGAGYLHAAWRRSNPLQPGQVHTVVDGIRSAGHYAGTYLAWGTNSSGWWGEGEVKFYLDGDVELPTICGTGTEDYFGGAWNFDVPGTGYGTYTTPYLGLPQVLRPDGLYRSQQRFDCTAGTFLIQSGSPRTCGSPSRRWGGAQVGDTCRCTMTSPRQPGGTSATPAACLIQC